MCKRVRKHTSSAKMEDALQSHIIHEVESHFFHSIKDEFQSREVVKSWNGVDLVVG